MAGLLNLMTSWLIRAVLISSFSAHVILVFFAGIRRRRATGGPVLLLWLAYQSSDHFAKYALSNLSLGSTSREQQLVAFWAAFLLVHLGGTDNITAFSLEDGKLWKRQAVKAVFEVAGATYVLYKHIYAGGAWTLLAASILMFAVGIAKYVEKILALRGNDLSSIRSSGKKKQNEITTADLRGDGRRRELGHEQALMAAHGLLNICKGAFADFSVGEDQVLRRDPSKKSRLPFWSLEEMCMVVEMELSLMYDILYTKAAVIHTWHGYFIRVASPIATATVFSLFWFYSKDGQRRADVLITYILLVATFILDVRWLLGALGSTWAYAFINGKPRCWLYHEVLWSGRWHHLRRVVVSLDPCRLFQREESSSYRMWSGSIGQYNLLHECTHDTMSLFSSLVRKVTSEDIWMDYQYSRGLELGTSERVRNLLFEQIRTVMRLEFEKEKEKVHMMLTTLMPKDKAKKEEEKKPCPPKTYPPLRMHRDLDDTLDFLPEYQEFILIWHIATDVFLLRSDPQLIQGQKPTILKTIRVLSDYMMFLVVVRSNLLPGLTLHSTSEDTRKALDSTWHCVKGSSSSSSSPSCTSRQGELIRRLREMEMESSTPKSMSKLDYTETSLYKSSIVLSDAINYAELLQRWVYLGHDWAHQFLMKPLSWSRLKYFIPMLWEETNDYNDQSLAMHKLLWFIFKVWVRLLIYVSIRCSRDSHARQLGRGGELTTIVWMLADHAGIIRRDMPQRKN